MKDNISTKDLSYINDMFNWNYNIIKTIELLENNISNEELETLIKEIKKSHIKTCENIKEVIK